MEKFNESLSFDRRMAQEVCDYRRELLPQGVDVFTKLTCLASLARRTCVGARRMRRPWPGRGS
jgi:hypothetical protein